MATLSYRGLRKSLGETVVIDGLDLDVADGELLALIGPSGCGKSTTLRLTAGFLAPDEGEILVDGESLSSAARLVPPNRRQMSMIFQSYAVWPHKTVFENVAFGLRVRKLSRSDIESRVRGMLDFVEMGAFAERYPIELSGGQQQRIALARALVIEPKVLLLDEPLSNLDANLREQMRYEIRRFHDELDVTTIYVTHDQAEAMVTADRVVVLREGRIEQIGSPEDVFERPATLFVANFMGRSGVPATVIDRGTVQMAGVLLKAKSHCWDELRAGQLVSISMLPQAMKIYTLNEAISTSDVNILDGTVRNQYYLGGSRDYEIKIKGSDICLNVFAQPWDRFQNGQEVKLGVPADHCWVIAER